MNIKNLFNKPEKIIKSKKLPQTVQDRFISEMAQNPHRKAVVMNIIDKMLKKDYKNAIIDTPITWLSPVIIKALKSNNLEPLTPVIAFERKQVSHSLNRNIKVAKQRLTEQQFKKIYDYLNDPDEIFFDTEKQQLLFVKFLPKDEVIEDRDCIKIPVIINSNNKNRPINYIGTTGRVNYNETFKNPSYKKIE